MSHRYGDTTYWLKSQIFPPPSHLAPSFGVTPSKLWTDRTTMAKTVRRAKAVAAFARKN